MEGKKRYNKGRKYHIDIEGKGKTGGGGEGHKEVPDDAEITTSDRDPFFGDRTAARRQCTQHPAPSTQQTGVRQMTIVPVTAQQRFETKSGAERVDPESKISSTSPTRRPQRLPKIFFSGEERKESARRKTKNRK